VANASPAVVDAGVAHSSPAVVASGTVPLAAQTSPAVAHASPAVVDAGVAHSSPAVLLAPKAQQKTAKTQPAQQDKQKPKKKSLFQPLQMMMKSVLIVATGESLFGFLVFRSWKPPQVSPSQSVKENLSSF
jgi:hypothetical protein